MRKQTHHLHRRNKSEFRELKLNLKAGSAIKYRYKIKSLDMRNKEGQEIDEQHNIVRPLIKSPSGRYSFGAQEWRKAHDNTSLTTRQSPKKQQYQWKNVQHKYSNYCKSKIKKEKSQVKSKKSHPFVHNTHGR